MIWLTYFKDCCSCLVEKKTEGWQRQIWGDCLRDYYHLVESDFGVDQCARAVEVMKNDWIYESFLR